MRSRKKKDDELTRLNKQIRELKAINRSLTKQLKKTNKYIDHSEKDSDDIQQEEQILDIKKSCKECARGHLLEVTIGNRKFNRCSLCGWRGKTEKI